MQLIFNNANKASAVFVNEDNVVVSDLKIVLNNDVANNQGAIRVINAQNVSLHNLDLTHHAQSSQSCGIVTSGEVHLSGKIKILSNNQQTSGVGIYNSGGNLFIDHAQIDIHATAYAILTGSQGITHITDNSILNLDSQFTFRLNSSSYGGNTLLIDSTTKINTCANSFIYSLVSDLSNPYTGNNDNYVQMAAGVTVNWTNKTTGNNLLLQTTEEYRLSNTTKYSLLTGENLLQDSAWKSLDIPAEEKTVENYKSQYLDILSQYNMLISDSSYKGINLLQGQNLQINFNEDRSAKIEVKGVKADSESLGLTTKEWESKEDIEKSISELENAINSLRSFASAFGNYYSIVTTRQDFTENLINVLEEGADKLTLADMNEESANMLALQTSQQLAINSLSLASQAAQSVLKLF